MNPLIYFIAISYIATIQGFPGSRQEVINTQIIFETVATSLAPIDTQYEHSTRHVTDVLFNEGNLPTTGQSKSHDGVHDVTVADDDARDTDKISITILRSVKDAVDATYVSACSSFCKSIGSCKPDTCQTIRNQITRNKSNLISRPQAATKQMIMRHLTDTFDCLMTAENFIKESPSLTKQLLTLLLITKDRVAKFKVIDVDLPEGHCTVPTLPDNVLASVKEGLHLLVTASNVIEEVLPLLNSVYL